MALTTPVLRKAAVNASPGPRSDLTIDVSPGFDEVVVALAGELDIGSVDDVDAEVRRLRHAGFARVVLDLRALTFVDSTGLRLLISLRNDAKRLGHRLELVPGSPGVQRLFEVTATRGLFDWRER